METLDTLVYGHTRAKKVLSVLLKRSRERYYKKCVLGEEKYPEALKCLLIGPSGTGKTHLIRSFKKLYGFPLISIDATQLMPTGNGEGINSKQLKKLIDSTAAELLGKPDYFSTEGILNQLVIFVDEFDKLGTCFDSSGNWNKHVQANFLTLIDDQEMYGGISWIFAGAFSGVYEKKSTNSKGIGFVSNKERHIAEITDEDIIKAGIIPEMLGRISLIVPLDNFTKDNYKEVLISRLLPNYENLKHMDDTHIEEIVEKAHTSGQGIRHLIRQLEMLSIEKDDENDMHCSWRI